MPPREPMVVEDRANDLVVIDGVPISGFVDDRLADDCLHQRIYSHDYDAYFCAVDNRWLERACGDPSCEFCRDRPEHPLPPRPDEPS